MSRVKVEGACTFYDQAGGQCNFFVSKRISVDQEPIPSMRTESPKGLSALSRLDERLVSAGTKAFLCSARGKGGEIYSQTPKRQKDCTQYSPGPQRTVRIRA